MTLAQVARHAGVSEATVSRVLNGKPGVSEPTRQRILTALDVVGYRRPSELAPERYPMVAIVMPELRNPIYAAFGEALGSVLAQRELGSTIAITTQGGLPEPDVVEMLLGRGIGGLVFVCGAHVAENVDPATYTNLLDRGMPVVAVNGRAASLARLPTISTDDGVAVELALRHLWSLGHVRVGLVTGDEVHIPAARKSAAFCRLVEESGAATFEPGDLIERSSFTIEGGAAAATRLIDRGVTGIVCGSDLIALGALRAARNAGLRVPADVSVVGYDDSSFLASTNPPLTTIRQPVNDMVREIVSNLCDHQMAGMPARGEEIFFEPDLVVRASTTAAPA